MENLDFKEALFVIRLLDSDITADILAELDDDVQEKILKNLSAKEIAEEIPLNADKGYQSKKNGEILKKEI